MDIFPDLQQPHKTPFVLEALGFYFPYQAGESPENPRPILKSSITPCPLPAENFIGFSWCTDHLRERQYDVIFLTEDNKPWHRPSKKWLKKYLYPAGEDGVGEVWSFADFKYLSESSDRWIKRTYKELCRDEGVWRVISLFIQDKFESGQLSIDVKDEWAALQRPLSGISTGSLYWKRKHVNDAVSLALGLEYRWGLPVFCGKFFFNLERLSAQAHLGFGRNPC